jgi:flagellar biosynthesis protein FlhA
MEKFVALFLRYRSLMVPAGILACIAVVLVPLPPALVDLLLVANIAISVMVLLTTLSVSAPLEFSVFPSILLATTLGRLALNIATTRLILTQDSSASTAVAGRVVEAFGAFVAGDKIEVGILLFLIIFLINFVVITKGATRIGEVAARFALDAMPGRQLAIDADLAAGAIDNAQAQMRRAEVTQQADFYGAMDGASKFVRGDALAGLVITALNLIGGIYMGVLYYGLSIPQAASTYSKLTIGDGLATQLPALLVSIAAAMLTTRSTQRSDLSKDLLSQVFSRPAPLIISGIFLGLLLLTSMPPIPILTLGGGMVGLAILLQKQKQQESQSNLRRQEQEQLSRSKQPDKKIEDYLQEDPLRLELGAKLVPLVDPKTGSDIMKRIAGVRTELAAELGILMPMVRIKDRLALGAYQYEFSLYGNSVASGSLVPERLLAVPSRRMRVSATATIPGDPAIDPATGKKALWIEPTDRVAAESQGYRVWDCGQVIANHLLSVSTKHASELLSRETSKQLIDQLRKTNPATVDDLIPAAMKLSEVQQILRNLLDEGVPIRPLNLILETIGDHVSHSKDPDYLTEKVRQRLSRSMCQRLQDSRSRILAITLDPGLEDLLGTSPICPPNILAPLVEQLKAYASALEDQSRSVVLLVNPQIRRQVYSTLRGAIAQLHVLSTSEISSDTHIESVGMVELSELLVS